MLLFYFLELKTCVYVGKAIDKEKQIYLSETLILNVLGYTLWNPTDSHNLIFWKTRHKN